MRQATALAPREVIAAIREHGQLLNSGSDTIEWRLICSVLKHLEPNYYTDGVLDALFQQVRPSAEQVGPNAAIRLESLIDCIFGRGSLASFEAPALRVRKLTGDTVLSLTREEVKGLSSVLRLRLEVGKAISKRPEEVSLVVGVQKLEDTEALEALLVEGTVVEVLLAIQEPAGGPGEVSLAPLKYMLLSSQLGEQLQAAKEYRRRLSMERHAPIDLVIQQGVVLPRLVELCQAEDSPDLQLEAAGALTTVAAGTAEQTRAVVEAGMLPTFVRMLQSPSWDVREQAVWGLGNIAGDAPRLRDLVLESGALPAIMHLLRDSTGVGFKRNAVWALSNFCRGKPEPNWTQVSPMLETLAQTLMSHDAEVMADTAWALCYFSDGPNERIAAVLNAGVLPRLVELLGHRSACVQTPTLRTVCNLSRGDDSHKQQVLSAGALPQLRVLLRHSRRVIRKESCLAISNLLAGNRRQIQGVLDAGLVPLLLQSLRGESLEVLSGAASALAKATSGGSAEQIRHLADKESCVPPMVVALDTPDTSVALLLMIGLENILITGDQLKRDGEVDSNPWVAEVVDADGVKRISRFLNVGVHEVAQKAQTLLMLLPRQQVML